MATTKITNPDLFDLGSLNTALQLPSGTTAERPTSPSTGEWRYNTDNNLIEFWDGGEWRELQDEAIPPVPSENFNTVLYTGNGATQSITGVGFQPDFVWIKDRTGSFGHRLIDSTTGADKYLESNSTSAQQGAGGAGLTSFDSDGFSLGSGNAHNANGNDFVAWCWKLNGGTTSSNTDGTITSTVQANTRAGFSIVSYTGTFSAATVGHGLSSAPELVIVKNTDSTTNWWTWTKDLGGGDKYLKLNGSDAVATATSIWDGTVPTSTVFSVANDSGSNGSGNEIIAYCFHSVSGYSKIGSYTGTGGTGNIVETGFEPAFVMTKKTSGTSHWAMFDNKRNTSNPRINFLRANLADAEQTDPTNYAIDFFSNGFQWNGNGNDGNINGETYIYIAFASEASTAPTLPDSFNTTTYTGSPLGTPYSVTGIGFRPDFVWIKCRGTAHQHYIVDTLRGPAGRISSSSSTGDPAYSPNEFQSFDSDGYTLIPTSGGGRTAYDLAGGYVGWAWKANPIPSILTDGTIQSIVSANQAAGFSIVKYTGNGVQGATVAHGLGSAPDIIIIKDLSSSEVWLVGNSESGWTKAMHLDLTNADNASNLYWDDTAPTSSVFSLGATGSSYNVNGNQYIAYCWYSISGFSKIGSYTGTGTGTNQLINTGFASSWVMIKDASAGGSWFIIDSDRGGSKSLKANATDTEATTNYITFESNGFRVAGDANATSTWLYLSFKENPTQYPLAGNMSFLVVAGGGSGAMQHGGGGGAGGLRTSYGSTSGGGASAESDITLAAGTYTITVGSGANGVTPSPGNIAGLNGSDSSIAATGLTTITSIGGGGGSAYIGQTTPGNGGSGGGGGNQSQPGGSGTAGQGFAGGTGSSSSTNYPTGGGGGASAVGGNGSGSTAGNGGAGLSVEITGSSVAYAGGAGGSSFRGGTAGTGGTGGGANGTNSDGDGNAGTVNTGGGGSGATAPSGGSATSGNGGSGIVILRLTTSEYSGTTTGSPTVTTDGDYTVLTYTGSGTYVHS